MNGEFNQVVSKHPGLEERPKPSHVEYAIYLKDFVNFQVNVFGEPGTDLQGFLLDVYYEHNALADENSLGTARGQMMAKVLYQSGIIKTYPIEHIKPKLYHENWPYEQVMRHQLPYFVYFADKYVRRAMLTALTPTMQHKSPEFQTLLKLDLLKFLNRKLAYYQEELAKNQQKLSLDFLNNFAWTAEEILIYTKIVKFLSTKLETWTAENATEINLHLDETFRLLQAYTLNAISNVDNSSSSGFRFANMAELKAYKLLLEIIGEALLPFKE